MAPTPSAGFRNLEIFLERSMRQRAPHSLDPLDLLDLLGLLGPLGLLGLLGLLDLLGPLDFFKQ